MKRRTPIHLRLRVRLGAGCLGLVLALGAVAVALTGPSTPPGGPSARGGLSSHVPGPLAIPDLALMALLLLGAAGLAALGSRRSL